MDQDSRDLVTWVLGTLVSLSILAGLVVRFVLLPWLRDHLVGPVQETHHQVTANAHQSVQPTIPDRLEDIVEKVDEATEGHTKLSKDMKAVVRVMDEHLAWSERWTSLVDRELELLRERLNRHHHGENGAGA